ncbi:MAG: SPFH domain-containing protein [Candidatus Omnitrophota bacterium]|jgi:regulator of protease activity HflC (stomatin/prohibitin superfamily)|nr:MAG: SPFH domain-containing protein [Candidatus Omnitrophota bacterium]
MSNIQNGKNLTEKGAHFWRTLQQTVKDVTAEMKIFHPQDWNWKRMFRFIVLLFLLVFGAAILSQGITRVHEQQVGIHINNVTGKIQQKERVGYHFHFPYVSSFYTLDKTIHRLDFSWSARGNEARKEIQLKTGDGSHVSLDVTISFKLIPEKAVAVLQGSGAGKRFADLWIDPYARQLALEMFGQLTTEEMYNAQQRNEKAVQCLEKMNECLNPQGIEVIAFILGDFRFYKEYEEVIQQKKLADQQVEEQQAQARASRQDQERQIVESVKKSQVRIREFEGECEYRLIQARAEARKIKREGDQYLQTMIFAADAAIYSASQEAVGVRANLLAEADGMERMRQALSGEGGVGLIGLEYARRLQETRFTGTPITRDAQIRQFSVQQDSYPFPLTNVPPTGGQESKGGAQ